ncbi:hypothetical protein KQI65_13865 [bacterium]|nr:hypothetical protein [bacterium]
MRWVLFIAVLSITVLDTAVAQYGVQFSHLRDARNVAWGQSAVAAAEGTSALFVNSSAAAALRGYGISAGLGQTLPTYMDADAADLAAAAAVLPGKLGVGLTWSTFDLADVGASIDYALLRLHAGYRLAEWLEVGVEGRRYAYSTEGIVRRDEGNNIISVSDGTVYPTYDLGLSLRISTEDAIVEGDVLRAGVQAANLLDTDFELPLEDVAVYTERKVRHLRLGALWQLPLHVSGSSDLKPRLLFGAGATYIEEPTRFMYSSSIYPGITAGASILDMFTLLFNYEDEIDDGKVTLPWYPVLRTGLLADLPVGKWSGMQEELILSISYTFWQHLGETDVTNNFIAREYPTNAASMSVHFTP